MLLLILKISRFYKTSYLSGSLKYIKTIDGSTLIFTNSYFLRSFIYAIRHLTKLFVPWLRILVFFRLIVRPKSEHAKETFSSICRSWVEWATSAASSANRRLRMVTIFRFRLALRFKGFEKVSVSSWMELDSKGWGTKSML